MTPTREQVQAWEDEAHNFADCHPDAEATDDAWSVIFHNKFAELACAAARAQALEDAAGVANQEDQARVRFPEDGAAQARDTQVTIVKAIRALKGKQ